MFQIPPGDLSTPELERELLHPVRIVGPMCQRSSPADRPSAAPTRCRPRAPIAPPEAPTARRERAQHTAEAL